MSTDLFWASIYVMAYAVVALVILAVLVEGIERVRALRQAKRVTDQALRQVDQRQAAERRRLEAIAEWRKR